MSKEQCCHLVNAVRQQNVAQVRRYPELFSTDVFLFTETWNMERCTMTEKNKKNMNILNRTCYNIIQSKTVKIKIYYLVFFSFTDLHVTYYA